MSVFENLVVAGAFAKGRREQDVYDLCAQILEDCELADKANVKANTLDGPSTANGLSWRALSIRGQRSCCSTKSQAA